MIRFEEVTKRFPGGQEALAGLSLTIDKGEMAFVTGHSGAGKSTLLRLIALIERPTAGQVIVDGRPVMQLNDKAENASSPGRTTVDFMDGQLEGQLVTDLFQVLEQKADAAKDLGVKSGNAELEFKGRILMQVDKDIPFSVLRSVMYTAGQAEFGEFRFVVIKADG